MKKFIDLMLAAIMICGASVFTSCNTDAIDNPVAPVDNLPEKIIGRWINAEMDGKPVLTNQKMVLNFVSPTKAFISASLNDRPSEDDGWLNLIESDVVIRGNKMTMTNPNEGYAKVVSEFTVSAISDKEFTAIQKLTVIVDGDVQETFEQPVRYVKVNDDFSAKIIGLWQGVKTTETSEYGNIVNHRWQYNLEGTYVFSRKNSEGEWTVSEDVLSAYFVAGNLLCTRWKNAGEGQEEHREWWEIESIEDGVMKWKALRQKEDGSTYIATFEMKRVDVPTQEEVEKFIQGKWMTTVINGKEVLTDQIVYEFESLTKAYVSASVSSSTELPAIWSNRAECKAVITDNYIMIYTHPDEHKIGIDELIITDITAEAMQCYIVHYDVIDGAVVTSQSLSYTFKKVDKDYSEAVIGTWEGKNASVQDANSQEQMHRLELKADGTYVYYNEDGESWTPSGDTLNEYFVVGNLLCMRWINEGTEYREWWEIESIEDGVMKCKAIRHDDNGITFTPIFDMTKVE